LKGSLIKRKLPNGKESNMAEIKRYKAEPGKVFRLETRINKALKNKLRQIQVM
jgi:hypothetical protein